MRKRLAFTAFRPDLVALRCEELADVPIGQRLDLEAATMSNDDTTIQRP